MKAFRINKTIVLHRNELELIVAYGNAKGVDVDFNNENIHSLLDEAKKRYLGDASTPADFVRNYVIESAFHISSLLDEYMDWDAIWLDIFSKKVIHHDEYFFSITDEPPTFE